jgi:hypothetical protein
LRPKLCITLRYRIQKTNLVTGDFCLDPAVVTKQKRRLGNATARAFFLSFVLAILCEAGSTLADDRKLPDPKHPPVQEQVYRELSDNTEFLLKTDFGEQETANSHLQKISRSLTFFGSFKFSADYRYGLAVDSWQLGQIADAIRDHTAAQPKWIDVLGDVADDLHAKISFASLFIPKKGIGEAPTPAPAVNIDQGVFVTASTLDKDRHEISGYEVWFCLKGLIDYPDRYDHFDLLSSPTKREMAAGNYVFWTQKGSELGSRVIVKGIGDGDPKRCIDLPIP